MFLSTYLVILFLSAILSSAFTYLPPRAASLNYSLSITQSSNLSLISNTDTHCIDLLNPFSRRPKYGDCTIAIRKLPQNPAVGAFHNHGTDDLFKLPVEKTFSSCTVRIELNAASSVVAASWPGISTKTIELNRRCLRTIFPIYKGGWATYAKHGRIAISLNYPDRSGGERRV